MSLPKISVLLSSYNHESYIRRSIESVLNQTFSDFELIVVDDCSTDNSKEIINSYNDHRIRAFYLEKNYGMGLAFNFALQKARGKYVARIDSDDFWRLDKLQQQFEFMEQNDEVGACFSWVKVIDERETELTAEQSDRVKLFHINNRKRSEWLHYFYFHGSCLCHTSAFIRRDIFPIIGIYNYSLKQLQDFDLWIRITKKYQIHVICEPLVYYRWFMSTTSNVSTPSTAVMDRSRYEFFYVFSKFFNDMDDETFIEAFKNEFIRKNACDHNELLCERAFILLKSVFCGNDNKIIALQKFNDLFQCDETREILYNIYGFTIQNYNQIAASKLFYEPQLVQSQIYNCDIQNDINLKNVIKKHLIKREKLFHAVKRLYNLLK